MLFGYIKQRKHNEALLYVKLPLEIVSFDGFRLPPFGENSLLYLKNGRLTVSNFLIKLIRLILIYYGYSITVDYTLNRHF